MIKQLKLWEHTKTWDNMYNTILKGLTKEYEFAESMIDDYINQGYKRETVEAFKFNTNKYT